MYQRQRLHRNVNRLFDIKGMTEFAPNSILWTLKNTLTLFMEMFIYVHIFFAVAEKTWKTVDVYDILYLEKYLKKV